mmetsp:Transcript_3617/g.6432  ORF Transcript_3617/g.6432 Transcript_3617/m.6432 type:complete len:98 (-) Transcript_3617:156-449(-)
MVAAPAPSRSKTLDVAGSMLQSLARVATRDRRAAASKASTEATSAESPPPKAAAQENGEGHELGVPVSNSDLKAFLDQIYLEPKKIGRGCGSTSEEG